MQLNSILRTLEKQREDDLNKQKNASTSNSMQNTTNLATEIIKVEPIKVELLDEVKSSINTRTLDLSIMDDFNGEHYSVLYYYLSYYGKFHLVSNVPDIVSNSCFEDEEDDDD